MVLNVDYLVPHLPAWLLVLFRMAGIFMLGPVFGASVLPANVKIFLAVGLSFCIYPMLLEPGTQSAAHIAPILEQGLSIWTLVPAIAMEMIIGLTLGFAVMLPLVGMQIGAGVIDQQMGLGIAGVFNPEIGEQTGIISEFFFVTAVTVFVLMDGHRVLLTILATSFSHVPLGGYRPDGHLLELVIGLLTVMMHLAVKIAGPLLCLVFLETVSLGFIARTVPQMNILSIGFPMRILAGAMLMVAASGVMIYAFHDAMQETLRRLMFFWT